MSPSPEAGLRPATLVSDTAARPHPSEWRFVAAVIALVLVLTSLPYAYAYLSTPPDRQFMGIMLDVPDHAQYFSWMRELSQANLAANKLTPEVNRPAFFNLLWWMLGRVGRLMGWDFAITYQLLRAVAAILFLLVAYRVCAWFLPDRTKRRMAFLILTFTSGFGWILVLMKYTVARGVLLRPMDVFTAEGNTFLGILGYPHFVAAALYILVFDLILRGEARSRLAYFGLAGLLAQFLGWQHAYDLVSVYGVLLAYLVLRGLRDRRLPRFLLLGCAIVGAISFWPALYSVWLTRVDPVWKGVLSQFANAGVFSPRPLDLVVLLGPAFLVALYSLVRRNPFRLSTRTDNDLFLQAWFLSYFVLIYLPVDFQVHLLNGWQVPIALLATAGLYEGIVPWITLRLRLENETAQAVIRRWAAVAMIAVILPTNLYLLAWRFIDLARHDYPFYVTRDDAAALAWLESNAGADDVVLSSLTIGQFVPAWTGANAFLAHWADTLDFFGKSDDVKRFYAQGTPVTQRMELLHRYGVDYIYLGDPERALGSYDPGGSRAFPLVYQNSSVQIFSVP
jgi:hypothetical protein